MTARLLNLNGSTERSRIMRSIFAGVIMLSASMAIVHPAQAEKQGYTQAVISHRQPLQASRDETIGADQDHSEQDALTKRIERDNTRLDRLIDICQGAEQRRNCLSST
jgi:hypothetical protein